MADKRLGDGPISSATAVLVGALASGVNGPTWNTLRSSFVMLGLCLALMLALAISATDPWLIFHVSFLIVLALSLFLLLSWFLSQTGFVSVENQMQEMNLNIEEKPLMKLQQFVDYFSEKLSYEAATF